MEKNENGCTQKRDMCRNDGLQLAMTYSPYQSWRMLMSSDDALKHGTLFEELYKPLLEVCRD